MPADNDVTSAESITVSDSETVTKTAIVPAEFNDNYDGAVTVTHDVDGAWQWHYQGVTSTEKYNHPSVARHSAPSPAK